jgi:hypothetical protein
MPLLGGAGGARAVPGRVAGDSPRSLDVGVAAWRLAIDGPVAGIQDPGSSADSSVRAEKQSHTPYEDKRADLVGENHWPRTKMKQYAENVPWEVVLPRGPPGRLLLNLSGILLPAHISSRCAITQIRQNNGHHSTCQWPPKRAKKTQK